MDLLCNVHEALGPPDGASDVMMVRGDYMYYHYSCDQTDDRVGIHTYLCIYRLIHAHALIPAHTVQLN